MRREGACTYEASPKFAGEFFDSHALAVSATGGVVVGDSRSALGFEAFRWTAAGGMQGLGDLPGGSFSIVANAVSEDGLTVVGRSNVVPSVPGDAAFTANINLALSY